MAVQLETGTPAASGRATVDDEVAALNERFIRAVAAGDPDAIADVYTPNADLLAPDVPPIRGRADIRAYWAAGLAAGIRGVRLETRSVERAADVVVETGGFVLRLVPAAGVPSEIEGKYVVVHRRGTDGSWRWQTDCFNTNGSPA